MSLPRATPWIPRKVTAAFVAATPKWTRCCGSAACSRPRRRLRPQRSWDSEIDPDAPSRVHHGSNRVVRHEHDTEDALGDGVRRALGSTGLDRQLPAAIVP